MNRSKAGRTPSKHRKRGWRRRVIIGTAAAASVLLVGGAVGAGVASAATSTTNKVVPAVSPSNPVSYSVVGGTSVEVDFTLSAAYTGQQVLVDYGQNEGGGHFTTSGSVTLQPGETEPTFQNDCNIAFDVTDDNSKVIQSGSFTVPANCSAPANHAPKANDDSATTTENTSVTVDVLKNDTDQDGDTLSVATFDTKSAHNGTVTLVNNELKYTPAKNFTGTDTFQYTAGDGKDGSNKATVTITVSKAAPTKVFVCKYVGKPGVNERLQTGQNPIEVSLNAIPEDPVVIGSYFADAQGRSYVLHYVDGEYNPTSADCPPGDTPPPPPCVTLSSGNVSQYGSLVWTGTSATVTLKQRDGGYCNDWTFDVTRYAPAAFPQTVQQVSSASVGKSGLSATASVYDTDCGQIDGYEGSGPALHSTLNGPGQDYEANHKFLSQVFGTNYNTWTIASEGCYTPPPPPTKVDVPAQPSVTDACGPGNATWNVPADTDSVVWTLRDDDHLIASTTPGYEFTDGTKSHDYGVAPDSNTACPVAAQPTVQVTADSCVMPGALDGKTLIVVTNTADDTHASASYTVAVTEQGKTDVTLHTGPIADGASETLTVLGLQPGSYGVAVTGDDMTGAGTSFVLTACQTPPPPAKKVVSVNIAATGANCGPKAIETYYAGGQLDKVTTVVTVAGKHVGLNSQNAFRVNSGQTWSVIFTVKDSANTELPNGKSTETFSGKNNEKPFACPAPPKHHQPTPPHQNFPIPHTGFAGTFTPAVTHPYAGLALFFEVLAGLGASMLLILGFGLVRRREALQQ